MSSSRSRRSRRSRRSEGSREDIHPVVDVSSKSYRCYNCEQEFQLEDDSSLRCVHCSSEFIEEASSRQTPTDFQADQDEVSVEVEVVAERSTTPPIRRLIDGHTHRLHQVSTNFLRLLHIFRTRPTLLPETEAFDPQEPMDPIRILHMIHPDLYVCFNSSDTLGISTLIQNPLLEPDV